MTGSGISWAICKSAPCSRQITMPAPHHSVFSRPDALPAAQPTASKHWRQLFIIIIINSSKQACCESSLVGAQMSPIGPSPGCSSRWSIMWISRGHRYAAVLPLPVLAMPIMSRPLSAIGMPCSYQSHADLVAAKLHWSLAAIRLHWLLPTTTHIKRPFSGTAQVSW